MTFTEIWYKVLEKYPVAKNPDKILSFKSKNFKKILRQVYKQGQKDDITLKSKDKFEDILDEII